MDPAVIILSNGLDDTLLDLDLKPFTFTTISTNDPKPMAERKVSYQYKISCNPDGSNPKNYTHDMQVDTYYDLIQHVFPPHSSTIAEYLVPEQVCNGESYDYNGLERFPCFTLDDEKDWYEEMVCLLDAIRLFKVNRAGFGLAILPQNGLGLNDRYKFNTDVAIWRHLPIFTLNEKERLDFQKFYTSYREWFFKTDNGSKDQLVRQLLNLYRLAFQVSDVQTSFIILSEIWELFSQCFPKRKKNRSDKFSYGNNGKEEDTYSISFAINFSVSTMVRNKGRTKPVEMSQDNIFDMVRYLYNQRSIIIHQSTDKTFDMDCIPLAFDMSRCLISKLINTPDREVEDIVKNIEKSNKNESPYPVPSIRLSPVSKELLKRINKYAKSCQRHYRDSHPS